MDSARKRLRRKLPVLMLTAAVLLRLAIGGSVGKSPRSTRAGERKYRRGALPDGIFSLFDSVS